MTTAAPAAPHTAPNLYHDLSWEQYAAIPAINGTALEHGRTSMAHLYDRLVNDRVEDSAALDFGTALHAAAFEPDRFKALVSDGPINERTGQPFGHDTKAFAEWRALNPNAIVLGPKQRTALEGMVESILTHPAASEIITRAGQAEVTCVWEQTPSGAEAPVRCKGRIDLHSPNVALVDLKSTICAAPRVFQREVVRRGYHRKAAFYTAGWQAVTGHRLPFVFIAVEKTPPYAVAVYALNDRFLEIGAMEVNETLAAYAKCASEGSWPAYADKCLELDAPAWLENEFAFLGAE